MRLYLKTKIAEITDGEKQIELYSKIYLSKIEEEHVKDYEIYKEEILNIKTNNSGESSNQSITLDKFLLGYKISSKNILDIVEYTKQIKHSCENIKLLFVELNKIGLEETVEYTKESPDILTKEDGELTFCYHCGEELKEPFAVCPHCKKDL